MIALESMPLWLGIIIALLIVTGSTLTLLGTIGLINLRNFYDRLHAPTLGTSWGAASILLASILLTSWIRDRAVLHEIVIGVFVMVTTPVTLMLLGRAALHRGRADGDADVPMIQRPEPGDDLPPDDLPPGGPQPIRSEA